MTNDTIQNLRREAESLAPTLGLANQIRFTVYSWQDEGLPLDQQEARLREIVARLSNPRYTFTVIN